jgi:hypothetical protein
MIGTIISWSAALLQVASKLKPDDKEIKESKNIVDGIGTAYNVLNTTSVSQSAGKVLIAPMVVFENTLIHQEYMSDLMTIVNLRDIKDALTHLAMQGQIGGMKIYEFVNQINPNRAGFMSLKGAEALDPPNVNVVKLGKPEPSVNIGGKQYADLVEYTPLAIGRTVEASVSIDGKPVTFPLNFRQIPMPVSASNLENTFAATKLEDGFYARVLDYKGGSITGPEFLSGTDKIKEEFKIRNNDLSGYYKEASARESINRAASIRTGIISINSLANTIIMTKETADRIELENGIKFNSSGLPRIRKAVKANTIVIVDDGMGIFTFFSAGSSMPEVYTRKEITVKSKKDTSLDLASLMKLFNGR